MSRWLVPLALSLSVAWACAGPDPSFVGAGGSTSSTGTGNGPGSGGAPGNCVVDTCPSADHAMPICVDEQCDLACDEGYDNCDGNALGTGCETDVRSDPTNCGMCNTMCPLGCQDSQCVTPQKMVATEGSACGLLSDGRLFCWGHNEYGEVGDGTQNQHDLPFLVPLPERAIDVAIYNREGDPHALACAVLASGLVYCWGDGNANGNPTVNGVAAPPSPVTSLASARSVSVGGAHTCAVRADDSLFCWGANDVGQLGNGTLNDANTPVQVLSNVKQVSAGAQHTCAVRVNGTLYCWGEGGLGQLGLSGGCPGGADHSSPTQIMGLTNVDHVYAGASNTCARVGNDAMCWGWDYNGGIGIQCSGCSDVPVLLSIAGPSFVQSGGREAGYAIAGANNTLYRWGTAPVPNDVSLSFCTVADTTSTGWEQISLGFQLACGIQNGVAVCFGDDSHGGVGDGPDNANSKLTPTPVAFPGPRL